MSMRLTPCLRRVSSFIMGWEADQLQSRASLGQASVWGAPRTPRLTRTWLAVLQLRLNLSGCELESIRATRVRFEKSRSVERWFSLPLRLLMEWPAMVPSPFCAFPMASR